MRRGNVIFIIGIIIFATSLAIFGLSLYKGVLMVESFPEVTVKDLLRHVTGVFVDTKDTPTQELKTIAVDVTVLFFAVITAIVLLIDGLIGIIIGISYIIHDRRKRSTDNLSTRPD
jgi:hypothetical protein